MRKRFEKDKEELQDQINSLENENKKYLDTLIKHSKGEISNIAPTLSARTKSRDPISDVSNSIPQGFQSYAANRAFQKSPPKIPKSKEFTYSKYSAGRSKNNRSSGSSKRGYKGPGMGGSIGQTQMRSLSLKQMKEYIADIYQQKIKFDKRCDEGKQPRETMEQYMYTYLNQKYGLRNLIIEWAAAIINGIKKYSKEDHTVSLFGKILRNEWDEEFRFIQMHVQQTLNDLLRIILKEKFPHKSEQAITQMHDRIWNGFIEDEYWAQIIEKMYDEQDWYTLEEMFRNVIQIRQQCSYSPGGKSQLGKRKLTREEKVALFAQNDSDKLLFSEFQKTVMDFQLKEHEKFLFKFISVFRQVDSDCNGILNEDEFIELVKKMGIWEDDQKIMEYLEIIDPYNNQQITFSEIVHLFSAQKVRNGGPHDPDIEIPILEKFAKEEMNEEQVR
jgi:hypothetical protein